MVPNARTSRKRRVGSLSLGSNAPLTASGSTAARPHSYAGRTQHLCELFRSPSVDIGEFPTLADLAGAAFPWDSHPLKTSAISQKSTTTRQQLSQKLSYLSLREFSLWSPDCFLPRLAKCANEVIPTSTDPCQSVTRTKGKTSELATQISNGIGSFICNKNINGWSSFPAARNWCTPQ